MPNICDCTAIFSFACNLKEARSKKKRVQLRGFFFFFWMERKAKQPTKCTLFRTVHFVLHLFWGPCFINSDLAGSSCHLATVPSFSCSRFRTKEQPVLCSEVGSVLDLASGMAVAVCPLRTVEEMKCTWPTLPPSLVHLGMKVALAFAWSQIWIAVRPRQEESILPLHHRQYNQPPEGAHTSCLVWKLQTCLGCELCLQTPLVAFPWLSPCGWLTTVLMTSLSI